MKSIIKLIFIFSFTSIFSQLSENANISIITTGSGDYLYEKFGHCAIRVKDDKNGLDEIYNYGIFDFNQTNFYWNFCKGYMKYKLEKYPFYLAIRSANYEKRYVKEQILNLTNEEKNEIFKILQINLQPQNSSYLYDPFYNNCATKPRDIILKIWGNKFVLVDTFSSNTSLRYLMNQQINQNTWGSLGINIALGSKLDRKITVLEYAYLPKYLFKILEDSKIKRGDEEVNIVKNTKTLLDFKPKVAKADSISPFLILSLLFLIVCFITFRNYKTQKRSKLLDVSLFFTTGLTGFILIFLSCFTNHSTTPYNFNMLWAFAPNLFVAFYLFKPLSKQLKYYIYLLILLQILIPMVWISGIQAFNWCLIPLLLTLFIRYLYLTKNSE